MSRFLDSVLSQARWSPGALAFVNSSGQKLTYAQLDEQSASLAAFLLGSNASGCPVAVYGHKAPSMLVSMFACMRAGFSYVPLDSSFPQARIDGILEQLGGALVLGTTGGSFLSSAAQVVFAAEETIAASTGGNAPQERAIAGEDVQYILFTSGSTGKPKGVMQRAESIDCLYEYFKKFAPDGPGKTVFNRAPFCFDVSLFDMVTALPSGGTMFSLDGEAEESMAKTFAALAESGLSLWFSTPSFVDMCLVDPSFNRDLLPNAECFVLSGETLRNSTARQLLERFPGMALYNGYGPTETQIVTDVLVTPVMAAAPEPLPIGSASPFNEIHIEDRQTHEELKAGQLGEIVVLGETVGRGYFGRPDLTEASFGERVDHEGRVRKSYTTGDEGYLDEDGNAHYLGRFDLQVKINGFRVELEEVEEAINAMPEVSYCCVVPLVRNGVNTALSAHVVPADGVEGTRELGKQIKARLHETLTAYMVPRSVKFHDALPTNINGKIDRKALEKRA